jgi:tetratricopeptide (TPR) repeat protein
MRDMVRVSAILGNIGVLYHEKFENELSLKYYYEALGLYELHGDTLNQIFSWCNIASVLLDLNDANKALDAIKRGLELSNTIGYVEYAQITTFAYYARVLNRLGRSEEALKYAFEVLPMLEGGKRQEMHIDILNEIVRAFEQCGDHLRALDYHKRLLELKLDVIKAQMDKDLKRAQMRHEVEKAEAEKEMYRLKSVQLEEELKANIQNVSKLGQEVIEKNEFLSFMKKKVQSLIPTANGSERALRSFVKEIEEKIASGDAHQQFEEALKQLHSDFLETLAKDHPELTSAEKKVCSLIKLGLNSHQIADLLFTSIRTDEEHSHSIRKK